MSDRTRRAVAAALAVVCALAVAPALAALELRGRLVDGANGDPIAGAGFRLGLIDESRSGRSWRGTTAADGSFGIGLEGLAALPAGAALVASVDGAAGGRPSRHSVAIVPRPGEEEIEFRLYGTSDDVSGLENGLLGVFFSLDGGGPDRLSRLSVRIMLRVTNTSRDLYVGGTLDRGALASTRACFRVPLPGRSADDVEVMRNDASAGAQPFTITRDGWAILDSPIPPQSESPRGTQWDLHYLVPASQEMVLPFPIDLPIALMYVFGAEKDLDLETVTARRDVPGLDKGGVQPMPDPDSGEERRWVVLHGRDIAPGTTLPVALTIDSIQLGQVNFRSLRTVAGFVLAALIAVLAGLVLGRRGPRVEAVLAGASGEEIIERIAQLDAQFQNGLVPKPEYREKRERLLSLARYEVPELAAAGGAGTASLPPAVLRLADRIGELEAGAGSDPKRIQERLLLLEELAREIARHARGAGETKRGAEGERAGERGGAGEAGG